MESEFPNANGGISVFSLKLEGFPDRSDVIMTLWLSLYVFLMKLIGLLVYNLPKFTELFFGQFCALL